MTTPLDNALQRLVKESHADAALVWNWRVRQGQAVVLGCHPGEIPPESLIAAPTEHDVTLPHSLIPDALLRRLPAMPTAGRSYRLDDDLSVTMVWCDPGLPRDLDDELRQLLDDLGALAQLTRDLDATKAEVACLRAAATSGPDLRYRRLMDNSAIGMCLIRPDGRFDVVNQALCDFFGYGADALKAKTWQELTGDHPRESDIGPLSDISAGRIDSCRLTKQYIHSDGHAIWGDISIGCLRDHRGTVEFFTAQIIDVTTEVHVRQQIAQRDQQNRALTQRLNAQSDRLRSELKAAGAYMTSLLPGDLDGSVQVSRRYLPSRELGGDCFDYRWIDDDHLTVYLVDVSGHGIAPALESISVHNLLRSGSLPAATLLNPGLVLSELNAKFQMDDHGGNYFTMWYGVYQASSRTLRYASAGHPPALGLVGGTAPVQLASNRAIPIGMFADTEFGCATYQVPEGGAVLLYSDGALELPLPEGHTWSLADFTALCASLASTPDWTVGMVAKNLEARTATGLFGDDCSLVLLRFG